MKVKYQIMLKHLIQYYNRIVIKNIIIIKITKIYQSNYNKIKMILYKEIILVIVLNIKIRTKNLNFRVNKWVKNKIIAIKMIINIKKIRLILYCKTFRI